MSPVQELRPGGWDSRDRLENVRRSWPALVAAAALLLVASRSSSGGTLLVVAGLTVLVTVPVVLLFERLGYQRERLLVSPDAVEKRRSTKLLARVDRTAGTLRALRFVPESAGRTIGFEQLLLTDGAQHLRLTSARWHSQHEAVLDALGLDAPLLRAPDAHRQVPGAFALWERRPNLVAGLSVLGVIVALLLGVVVLALVSG